MKERIARAICRQELQDIGISDLDWTETDVDVSYQQYMGFASAVLNEMLNPTEGMLDSAHECTVSGCCLVSKEAANDVWNEMIQSAIEGK